MDDHEARIEKLEKQVQTLRTALALALASGQPSITWMDKTFDLIEEESKAKGESV